MNKFLTSGVVAATIIFLSLVFLKKSEPGVSPSNIQAGVEEYRSADKVLDLSFVDYSDNTVKLRDFGGRHMLINVWAASCPFCKQELSDFTEVQKEFGDKVVIIAINRAEPLESAKPYSEKLGVTDKLVLLFDPTDSFYQAIGGFSMPETVFVARDGKIRYHKRGPMELEEIRRRVQDAFDL